MTTKEVSVPYMVDDFEQDDIVWHSNLTDNTFLFGRVSTNDADTIYASCEDGIMHIVPIESFGKRSRNGEIWGKLLDISQLKTGSRLSPRVVTKESSGKLPSFGIAVPMLPGG